MYINPEIMEEIAVGRKIEVMDTTNRDGEQIRNGNHAPEWKLATSKSILEAGVDRVEVCSARGFSGKEQKMLRNVTSWAESVGLLEKIEVLTFVDGRLSVDWVRNGGGKVINLLCKGSALHCREQLRRSPAEHLRDIEATVKYAVAGGMRANVYLEDWSQGMKNSLDYVRFITDGIVKLPVERIMLCDTLGTLNIWNTENYVANTVRRYPDIHFDFHGHDDYGLATANSLAAIKAGAKGIHCTVNGLGERAGNASLDEVVVGIHDHLPDLSTGVNELHLFPMARKVALMSGRRIPFNKPICGENVFSNTAGVHADGDRKAKLYEHPLLKASRFGARVRHPLGKLSGKSNVILNLERLGWKLDNDAVEAVLMQIVRLADEGKAVTIGDLPFIVASVLNRPEMIVFETLDVQISSRKGKRALADITVRYKGKEYEIFHEGDGGFDAFMNALRQWARKIGGIQIPQLKDYRSGIPPGGNSSALVEVIIDWEGNGQERRFQTQGVDYDQVLAAIEAASLAVNLCNCNGNS